MSIVTNIAQGHHGFHFVDLTQNMFIQNKACKTTGKYDNVIWRYGQRNNLFPCLASAVAVAITVSLALTGLKTSPLMSPEPHSGDSPRSWRHSPKPKM
jgi:hypothetical protein